MRILLVDPGFNTKYPPLGLLKLGSFYRSRGYKVKLVRGLQDCKDYDPDRIEITSLFTYAWTPVHNAIEYYHQKTPDAKTRIGGIYASMMPDRIRHLYPYVTIQEGLVEDAERYLPSYDLLSETEKWKKWNSSIVFSSRGCIRRCPFCIVPKLEGKIRSVITDIQDFIYPGHRQLILWDNNFLSSPNWKEILQQLKDCGLKIDFNQGLDARLVNEDNAAMLADLKMPVIRMAYDDLHEHNSVTQAVSCLLDQGVRSKEIIFYTLFNYHEPITNFGDSPDSFLKIIQEIAELGCTSYPMRYEPLDSLKKNEFVSPKWTSQKLEMIADARRVIGFGGAFPPYKGLVNKFLEASTFNEAFGLRPTQIQKEKTTAIG